jgi:stage V sporulation protein B
VPSESGTRRGAIAIGAAKVWFLIAGLALNMLLPVAIGQGGFGAYKRSLAFVNVFNNVIVAASLQAMSRAVAAAPPGARRATMLRAFRLQALIGAALGAVFFLSVPAIVAHQHAPHLAAPLRVLAAILVAYGLYAPLVGALNGARAFGAQAALDATYSTLRTALTTWVGFVFARRLATDGALGAAIGFLAAAVIILLPAWLASRRVRDDEGEDGAPFDARVHLGFFAGVLVMQAFQALLLQVDLMVLGRRATLLALGAGATEGEAQRVGDQLAGLYAQAQAFGLVPYQLLIAAGFVLFPAVAAARARGDDQAVRDGVARGGAATLIVAGALVASFGGAPMAVLRFAFGHSGADALPLAMAAPILSVLVVAHGLTAVVTLGTTLIAASGRGRLAATMSAIAAALALIGITTAASSAHAPAALGIRVALGLAISLAVSAAIVAVVVGRAVGPYVRPITLARVIAGVASAFAIGAYVPVPSLRPLAPLAAFVPLGVYLAVVALLGEPLGALIRARRT